MWREISCHRNAEGRKIIATWLARRVRRGICGVGAEKRVHSLAKWLAMIIFAGCGVAVSAASLFRTVIPPNLSIILYTLPMNTLRYLVALLLVGLSVLGHAQSMRDRWFYVSRSLASDQDIEELFPLVETASRAGLNGMLLSCGLEGHAEWPAARKARLQALRRHCDAHGVEIIPIIWSIGYGVMLSKDPNLCAGIPIADVPYLVEGTEARVMAEAAPVVPNGDFELHDGDVFPFQGWIDRPGVVSFADTEVRHGGTCSLRLENFASDPVSGHGRVCFKTALRPNTTYRLSCQVRVEDFASNPAHAFRMQFYGGEEHRMLSFAVPDIEPQGEWTNVSMVFSSGELSEGYLYVGVWEGKSGKVWIDDLKLEMAGVNEVLRRPGTPFVVRNALTGQVYVEGEDYEPVPPLKRFLSEEDAFSESLVLKLTDHSAIRDGDRLAVSYYRPASNGSQRTTCMSEPRLYELLEQSAHEIASALHPRKWFLSMDEIRAGGTCAACVARNTDMAHILAECIVRQCQFIREVCPEAEIYIWSDMLDPNHNAHDNYYSCKGTFAGVWELIPKELVIACWHDGRKAMPFFSGLGFRTLGAAYYDADDLDGSRDWLQICRQTPGCRGIMYTSWQNKYQLLEAFGDMIRAAE